MRQPLISFRPYTAGELGSLPRKTLIKLKVKRGKLTPKGSESLKSLLSEKMVAYLKRLLMIQGNLGVVNVC